MKHAIGYLRVSTAEQGRSGLGPAAPPRTVTEVTVVPFVSARIRRRRPVSRRLRLTWRLMRSSYSTRV
jgi:hypothetical protein